MSTLPTFLRSLSARHAQHRENLRRENKRLRRERDKALSELSEAADVLDRAKTVLPDINDYLAA